MFFEKRNLPASKENQPRMSELSEHKSAKRSDLCTMTRVGAFLRIKCKTRPLQKVNLNYARRKVISVNYALKSSRFAALMRINNIKLELKIKRTKQVILANRQETASVSVHERAKRRRYVRGSARRRCF